MSKAALYKILLQVTNVSRVAWQQIKLQLAIVTHRQVLFLFILYDPKVVLNELLIIYILNIIFFLTFDY